MSESAKFVRVAEDLYRFSRSGKTSGLYYAYFWRDGKQIKRMLAGVDLEQTRRELAGFRKEADRLDPAMRRMTLSDLLNQ